MNTEDLSPDLRNKTAWLNYRHAECRIKERSFKAGCYVSSPGLRLDVNLQRSWSGALKMQDRKMQDLKMQDQIAGDENAGPENEGPNRRA